MLSHGLTESDCLSSKTNPSSLADDNVEWHLVSSKYCLGKGKSCKIVKKKHLPKV